MEIIGKNFSKQNDLKFYGLIPLNFSNIGKSMKNYFQSWKWHITYNLISHTVGIQQKNINKTIWRLWYIVFVIFLWRINFRTTGKCFDFQLFFFYIMEIGLVCKTLVKSLKLFLTRLQTNSQNFVPGPLHKIFASFSHIWRNISISNVIWFIGFLLYWMI